MDNSTKIKIIAVIVAVAGPFMAFYGHQEKERLAKLEKEGVTVDGTIEGGASHKGRKRSTTYSLDVAFTPEGGVPVHKSFKVKANYFKEHIHENTITDPAVKVRYLTGDAQNSAVLVNGSTDNALMFPLGLGALGLGSLTALGMFMRKK